MAQLPDVVYKLARLTRSAGTDVSGKMLAVATEDVTPPFRSRSASTASRTPSATSSPRRKRVEAQGTRVRYLNIGDPVAFGFKTPPHLIAAVERAMRDGHNGYGPSPGIAPAREAVAARIHVARLPGLGRSRVHHGRHVGRRSSSR